MDKADFKRRLERRIILASTKRQALTPAQRKRRQRAKADADAALGYARLSAETIQQGILDVLGDMLRGGDPRSHAAVITRAVAQAFSVPEQAERAIRPQGRSS